MCPPGCLMHLRCFQVFQHRLHASKVFTRYFTAAWIIDTAMGVSDPFGGSLACLHLLHRDPFVLLAGNNLYVFEQLFTYFTPPLVSLDLIHSLMQFY